MKILLNINHPKTTALEYYRLHLPHKAMMRLYPDDVQIYNCNAETTKLDNPRIDLMGRKVQYDHKEAIETITDDELKTFNIIVFLREVRISEGSDKDQIKRCKNLGLKVVFDIDDYWNLPENHPMKPQYRSHGVNLKTPQWISSADMVTTTTPYFASTITEQTDAKWVVVLPNCIDPIETQFQDTTATQSRRVRFGWVGGVYHSPDVELLKNTFEALNRDRKFMDDVQLCLGGYNHATHEYRYLEKLMTTGYGLFRWDKTYIEYLNQQTEQMDHVSLHKPYRRLWSREITKYAGIYNEIDVALVPLRDTRFSKCKSELKIIEAGWFSRPVIVSNITPYKEWIKDGVNGYIGTGYSWVDKMKLLMDKNRREDMGKALKETITEHFDIKKWAEYRYQLYKKLLE